MKDFFKDIGPDEKVLLCVLAMFLGSIIAVLLIVSVAKYHGVDYQNSPPTISEKE